MLITPLELDVATNILCQLEPGYGAVGSAHAWGA